MLAENKENIVKVLFIEFDKKLQLHTHKSGIRNFKHILSAHKFTLQVIESINTEIVGLPI